MQWAARCPYLYEEITTVIIVLEIRAYICDICPSVEIKKKPPEGGLKNTDGL
jgi:hypothetical protein